MRLCLVSSIISIIVFILLASHTVTLWILGLLVAILVLLFCLRSSLFVNRLLPASAILVSIVFSALYTNYWIDERLSSRLPAKQSGSTISGLAKVIDCDYTRMGVERYQLELIKYDALDSTAQLPRLRKLSLSRYLNFTKESSGSNYEASINTSANTKISSKFITQKMAADTTTFRKLESKRCGYIVKFSAKLRAPYSFINPVGFDYEAWLLSRGIDASGYLTEFEVLNDEALEGVEIYDSKINGAGINGSVFKSSGFTAKELANSWQLRLVDLRQKGIDRAASLPELSGQVVPALLFGISGYLSKDRWSDLQTSGAIHLLVVSGLHIGFLVLLAAFLFRKLMQLEMLFFSPSHSYLLRLMPVVILFVCLLYAFMAGLGLAVQRASLMLMITMMVVHYKSHWSLLDTWLWVMWLVLMINPLACLSIGFWFSFMAVGGLMMTHIGKVSVPQTLEQNIKQNEKQNEKQKFSQRINQRQHKVAIIEKAKKFNLMKYFIRPQWIVFIALIPFLWLFQQSQSILSLLVNSIAIPLLAICILPLSILSFIFGAGIFTQALNYILTLSFSYLEILSTQSNWLVFKPTGLWLGLLLLLVFTILMFKGFPFRRLCLVLVVIIYSLPLKETDKRLVVLDVGQGLAVVGTGKSSWVYDTGAKFRSGFSLGQAVVTPNLLAMSSKDLDLLFISHSDNDHAGGEVGLKRTVNVYNTYAGQMNAEKVAANSISLDHVSCHSLDTQWRSVGSKGGSRGEQADDWQWRVFNIAMDEQLSSDNDLSCVVQIKINGIRLLLPGDISKKVEAMLVASYADELMSDVLVVPHHGSKTSSSQEFIQQVAPKIAVISSGFKNTFNHPHKSVVQRYQDLGVEVYNTAESGAVEIDLSDNIPVLEWRKVKSAVWRQ